MERRVCERSAEQYTGADRLITLLEAGWVVNKPIRQEEYCRSGRVLTVYRFELEHAGETIVMAVVDNPYVRRFVAQSYTPAILPTL